ncbi:hypothetical protein J2S13_002772 [Oikeobacillus pervagus]|uniref:Uncharacterized protein n=1 Tax=Oikeobacillus pervagus TaxID=1325931 RepID=A0AAJ1WLL4_9BACI|nr:hypothetical protein [Oikeobacillus pervagus]
MIKTIVNGIALYPLTIFLKEKRLSKSDSLIDLEGFQHNAATHWRMLNYSHAHL